jgi:pimeloyl-ACP methyl ester carboxylesterase
MWKIILCIWFVIDIIRYIKYCKLYNKLVNYITESNNVIEPNIIKFLKDIKNREIFEKKIKDMYFSKVELEDMYYDDVCDGLYDIIDRNPKYINNIKNIVKSHQVKWRKKGRDVFKGNKVNKRFNFKRNKIKSWFHILPLFLILNIYDKCVKKYMKILGYKCKIVNNIHIWYSEYEKSKGKPLLFFHSSVGGITIYLSLLKTLHKNYNIIMPEIPGISFMGTDKPPMNIIDISNSVVNFTKEYMDDNKKINIMGHSLGNLLCSTIVNLYPEIVNNFFCIEGQIFIAGCIRIFSYFELSILETELKNIFRYILFYRNIFLQYYLTNCISIDSCFIYDLKENNNKNIKIHMFHFENDELIKIKPQLKYANYKGIPINYHLFKGDYSHGSFIFSRNIINYITDNIKKIYDDDKN